MLISLLSLLTSLLFELTSNLLQHINSSSSFFPCAHLMVGRADAHEWSSCLPYVLQYRRQVWWWLNCQKIHSLWFHVLGSCISIFASGEQRAKKGFGAVVLVGWQRFYSGGCSVEWWSINLLKKSWKSFHTWNSVQFYLFSAFNKRHHPKTALLDIRNIEQ